MAGLTREQQARIADMRRVRSAEAAEAGLRDGWAWFYNTVAGDGAPAPRQMELIEARDARILYGGAKGGGKTRSVLWRYAILGQKYPGIVMLAGRQFWTHTEQWLVPKAAEYFAQLGSELGLSIRMESKRKTQSHVVYRFWNGSKIVFLGYDDSNSFQGGDVNQLWIDEANHVNQKSLKEASGRMRGESRDPNDPRGAYPVNMIFTTNYASGYLHTHIAAPHKAGRVEEALPYSRFIESSTYDLEVKYNREAELRGQPSYIETMRTDGLHSEEEIRGYAPAKGLVWPLPSREKGNLISTDEFARLWGAYDPDGRKGVSRDGRGEKAYFGLDHGNIDSSAIMSGLVRVPPGLGAGGSGCGYSGTKETVADNVLVIGGMGEFYEPLGDRPHSILAEKIAAMMGVIISAGEQKAAIRSGNESRRIVLPEHYVSWDPRMKNSKNQAGMINTAEHPSAILRRLGIHGNPSPLTGPYQRATRFHLVRQGIAGGKIVFVDEGTENLWREMSVLMMAGAEAAYGEDQTLPKGKGVKDHMADAFSYLVAYIASLRLVDFGVVSEREIVGAVDVEGKVEGLDGEGLVTDGVDDMRAVQPDGGAGRQRKDPDLGVAMRERFGGMMDEEDQEDGAGGGARRRTGLSFIR